ncbi:hypothetical protein PMAC_000976 [Pneumocystis sp. 'macacae']|nr:hypothetical protein PMAC_000976 [Pneumocystis sp. 'macacae']
MDKVFCAQNAIEEVLEGTDGISTSCNLWLNLLNSVSSVKKTPLKHLILLGGGNRGATEWISSLKQVAGSYNRQDSFSRDKEQITSPTYLMDYTYIELMDPDHGEILAVIEVYLISELHLVSEAVLSELFTPEFLENCAVCILLDWTNPWQWSHELSVWIQLLKKVIENFKSKSELCDQIVLKLTELWKHKIQICENLGSTLGDLDHNNRMTIPLEPGQYDEPLGLPLICVCNHSEYMATIEKDELLKDEHFDFIQQFLRTILMKHGGALCYTSDLYPDTLNSLLYTILDSFFLSPQIYMDISLPPKANVIDRDHIFVPAGWDSWGKIRIIRSEFDVEGVAEGWCLDLNLDANKTKPGAMQIYEETILDYRKDSSLDSPETKEPVTALSLQEFLLNQLNTAETKTQTQESPTKTKKNIANAHAASTQLNLCGMKLDTDEVVERLQKLRVSSTRPC